MKRSNVMQTGPSPSNWQVLGELELPVGANAGAAIHPWITELLDPLRLHPDFLSKILKSATDAAGRALLAENGASFGHIHLMVYIPEYSDSRGGTWGFFRVEKLESAAEGQGMPSHAVEVYLYLEGE